MNIFAVEDVAIGYPMIVRSLAWNGNYRVYNHDGQTTQFLATLTTSNHKLKVNEPERWNGRGLESHGGDDA